jgi:hypothetical protein
MVRIKMVQLRVAGLSIFERYTCFEIIKLSIRDLSKHVILLVLIALQSITSPVLCELKLIASRSPQKRGIGEKGYEKRVINFTAL